MYFNIDFLQMIIYAWLDIFIFSLLISLPLVLFFSIIEIFFSSILIYNKK